MAITRQGMRAGVILFALSLLSACGFHLRGAVVLPEVMARTHIIAPPDMPLAYELKSLLLSAGASVVETPLEATALLTLHHERLGRRTLSISTAGVASEYELTLEAEFSMADAQGKMLADHARAAVRRTLSADPANLLGKASEEAVLAEEMRRDLARQMLRRLRALAASAGTKTVESAPVAETTSPVTTQPEAR